MRERMATEPRCARLARLPLRQRTCLVLRYYEDLSDKEIADLLHCGVAAVRSNISRALASLRIEPAVAAPLSQSCRRSPNAEPR
jgi:DNA-directed RNA polymerase specialized sigma subunit